MQIPPRDQRRLLFRVVAVLLAMRAVSILSVDLNATEVTSAHGLGFQGGSPPALSWLVNAWFGVAGHVAGVLRLPSLVMDLALVLLTVRYARRNNWGTLVGLYAGFVLAMAPLGLDEGWRADGTPLMSLLALGALFLARSGLQMGQVVPAAASSLLVLAASFVSPVGALLVPVGLYAAVRSVTGPPAKWTVAAGWTVAAAAGIGAHSAVWGTATPLETLALGWLADPSLNGTSAGLPIGPLDGFVGALAAVSPGGPSDALAGLLEVLPAPEWRIWLGVALWPLALGGLLRGQVMADPPVPKGGAVSAADGAGARDGWRSLGVAVPTAPRLVGERDYMPLLLGVIGPAGWVAWATSSGDPAGIPEALALARPFAALLLGLGLTGLSAMTWRPSTDGVSDRRRFVLAMITFTLLQLGLGGHHVLMTTASPDRVAPHKVATFIRSEIGAQPVLAVGPIGQAIAYKLDPYRADKTVVRASLRAMKAASALEHLLAAKPNFLAVCGDRGAFDSESIAAGELTVGLLLDRGLQDAGYEVMQDGARVLGNMAVRVYERDAGGGQQIKPQLGPDHIP